MIGGSSNYTNGSLVSATSRSLLKLDQALNRGGWAGTHNTPRTDTHRYSKVRPSARGAAGETCNADGPSAMLRIEQHQLARGRHTNRITGCLSGFPLGIPFPQKRRRDHPHRALPHPPVWFHDGYRPCNLAPSRWVHSRVTLGVTRQYLNFAVVVRLLLMRLDIIVACLLRPPMRSVLGGTVLVHHTTSNLL